MYITLIIGSCIYMYKHYIYKLTLYELYTTLYITFYLCIYITNTALNTSLRFDLFITILYIHTLYRMRIYKYFTYIWCMYVYINIAYTLFFTLHYYMYIHYSII